MLVNLVCTYFSALHPRTTIVNFKKSCQGQNAKGSKKIFFQYFVILVKTQQNWRNHCIVLPMFCSIAGQFCCSEASEFLTANIPIGRLNIGQ